MREERKIIELGDKTYRVGFFDALTGSHIALKLLSKVGYLAAAVTSGELTNSNVLVLEVAGALGGFSRVELNEIQLESLKVCQELTHDKNGQELWVPVVMQDGRFGDKSLAQDPMNVLALTAHALATNILPFFEGDRLKSLLKTFQIYSSALPALTSTNSSGHPLSAGSGDSANAGTGPIPG